VKFLRHLTAVVVAVAVIVGLGMLWAHASGGRHRYRQRPQAGSFTPSPPADGAAQGRHDRVQSDNGFHLADTGNLIRTFEIEAVLAAIVITVSAVRRRHRRIRRAAKT
jgi:hypothetical protein